MALNAANVYSNSKIQTAASLDGTPALLLIKSGSVNKKYFYIRLKLKF